MQITSKPYPSITRQVYDFPKPRISAEVGGGITIDADPDDSTLGYRVHLERADVNAITKAERTRDAADATLELVAIRASGDGPSDAPLVVAASERCTAEMLRDHLRDELRIQSDWWMPSQVEAALKALNNADVAEWVERIAAAQREAVLAGKPDQFAHFRVEFAPSERLRDLAASLVRLQDFGERIQSDILNNELANLGRIVADLTGD